MCTGANITPVRHPWSWAQRGDPFHTPALMHPPLPSLFLTTHVKHEAGQILHQGCCAHRTVSSHCFRDFYSCQGCSNHSCTVSTVHGMVCFCFLEGHFVVLLTAYTLQVMMGKPAAATAPVLIMTSLMNCRSAACIANTKPQCQTNKPQQPCALNMSGKC